MKEIILNNQAETEAFGKRLAERLEPGDVIAMTGNLGAGKTALTKAIAAGMGVRQMVTSPTFTIMQEYRDGRLPLYHFDVYRILDPEDMYELGYEDYFFGNGVTVVEWADQIAELIPDNAIHIEILYGSEEDQRILHLWGKGFEEE